MVKFLFKDFDTGKKKLPLARISPRNIYLNLIEEASTFSLKESKSLQHSKQNLFELCLNCCISMKLLFT